MSCDKNMSFEECELTILRSAVDKTETLQGEKLLKNPDIKNIISNVEKFIKDNKLICYGGTAINNILPKDSQFYNLEVELPDYDFYSYTPLEHAKTLADLYNKLGYTEVEAKAGMHPGTFKVYVDFLPIADITYIPKELFIALSKEAIKVNDILYCPPDYLRMSMYLELSRPRGDVSRWEKVLKRLTLLNKHYPMKYDNDKCNTDVIQRIFDEDKKGSKKFESNVFNIVLNGLIDQSVVFFGAFANKLYLKTLKEYKNNLKKIPDFDVLSENPQTTAKIIKEKLERANIKNVKIIKKSGIGEIIAPHYGIVINEDAACFIYGPLGCHSYNITSYYNKKVRIATIDTILSFYLAFMYINRDYYDKQRLLCMCNYLFKVQQKNRLKQKGILKRFSISCYGDQETIENIRSKKSQMFNKLKNKKSSKEYEEWFLKYNPAEKPSKTNSSSKTKKNKSNIKKSTKKNKTKKNFLSRIIPF